MSNDIIKDNMSDNEIRVLGPESADRPSTSLHKNDRRRLLQRIHIIIGFVALATAISAAFIWLYYRSEASLQDGSQIPEVALVDTLSIETLKVDSVKGNSHVVVSDTIINDIPLRILTPSGCHMELYVGHKPAEDNDILLAVHAADMRGDNKSPAGAFVHKGNLLAKGHSKYGFCAIINGTVSIGRQIETPLFERAIEQNGSFFRQYSLVSNGKLMNIPPKGKSKRRALCLKDSMFLIVESKMPESYHDFSLALENFGVSEALALVGSNAAIMWRDDKGAVNQEGVIFGDSYPLENYITWRIPQKSAK